MKICVAHIKSTGSPLPLQGNPLPNGDSGSYVFLSCDSNISKHDHWVRERESWRSFHYLSLEMILVTFVHWLEIVLWLCAACNTASKCGNMHACSVGNLCYGRRSGLQLIHLLLVYLLGKVLKRMKNSHLYSSTFYSRNWCRTRRERKDVKKEKQWFTLWLGFNLLGSQLEIYICISFWRPSYISKSITEQSGYKNSNPYYFIN